MLFITKGNCRPIKMNIRPFNKKMIISQNDFDCCFSSSGKILLLKRAMLKPKHYYRYNARNVQVFGYQVGYKRRKQHKADGGQTVVMYALNNKSQYLTHYQYQPKPHPPLVCNKLQRGTPKYKCRTRYRGNRKAISHQCRCIVHQAFALQMVLVLCERPRPFGNAHGSHRIGSG
jgi:hypothetical protein